MGVGRFLRAPPADGRLKTKSQTGRAERAVPAGVLRAKGALGACVVEKKYVTLPPDSGRLPLSADFILQS